MYGNRFLDMCDSIEQDIYEKKPCFFDSTYISKWLIIVNYISNATLLLYVFFTVHCYNF